MWCTVTNTRSVWTAVDILFLTAVVVAELNVKPNNTAVLEGTVAVMRCSTSERNKSVLWKFLNPSSGHLQTFFTGTKVYQSLTDFYEVNKTKEGQHDLLVKANTTSARYYVCEEAGGKSAGAELIVFESTPKCEITGIGSATQANRHRSLEAKCVIRFAGNWAPEMNWKIIPENDGKQQIIDLEENNTYAERLLISSVIITAQPNYNGCRLEFRATFTHNHRSINHTRSITSHGFGTTADNIPEYLFAWNSSKLTVSEDSQEFFFIFEESHKETDRQLEPHVKLIMIISISCLCSFVIILIFLLLQGLILRVRKKTIRHQNKIFKPKSLPIQPQYVKTLQYDKTDERYGCSPGKAAAKFPERNDEPAYAELGINAAAEEPTYQILFKNRREQMK